jgi:hypothetical protein
MVRIVALSDTTSSGCLLWVVVLACIVAGFTLAYFKNYKVSNSIDNPHRFKLQELVLLMKGTCFHIHHWMWALLLVSCILFGHFVKNRYVLFGVAGFLLGLSLEDGLFKDWSVVTNNCHKNQLVAFMQNTVDVHPQFN